MKVNIDNDINVGSWAKNLAELRSLQGHSGLIVGPTKIGKTQQYEIAVALTKARKSC